jgi:hypothetical protein
MALTMAHSDLRSAADTGICRRVQRQRRRQHPRRWRRPAACLPLPPQEDPHLQDCSVRWPGGGVAAAPSATTIAHRHHALPAAPARIFIAFPHLWESLQARRAGRLPDFTSPMSGQGMRAACRLRLPSMF